MCAYAHSLDEVDVEGQLVMCAYAYSIDEVDVEG